jgi:hypothetical protein
VPAAGVEIDNPGPRTERQSVEQKFGVRFEKRGVPPHPCAPRPSKIITMHLTRISAVSRE